MSIAEQCTFLHHVILKCETEPYMQHYRPGKYFRAGPVLCLPGSSIHP